MAAKEIMKGKYEFLKGQFPCLIITLLLYLPRIFFKKSSCFSHIGYSLNLYGTKLRFKLHEAFANNS